MDLVTIRYGVIAMVLGGLAFGATADAEDGPIPPARPETFPALSPPPEVTSAVASPALPVGRSLYLPMLYAEAKARGLPAEVADAVARIESGYNSAAIGGDGERGMMQVMPPTAAMLGFKGTAEQLADPATNIRLGVTYLAGAWKRANGDLCRALMKYRAGHNEEHMSALSVEYCRRAKSHLAAIGSPLGAGAVPMADFDMAPRLGGQTSFKTAASYGRVKRVGGRLVRVMPVHDAAWTRRFWAAHTARIRAIEARLPWKRGGIART